MTANIDFPCPKCGRYPLNHYDDFGNRIPCGPYSNLECTGCSTKQCLIETMRHMLDAKGPPWSFCGTDMDEWMQLVYDFGSPKAIRELINKGSHNPQPVPVSKFIPPAPTDDYDIIEIIEED